MQPALNPDSRESSDYVFLSRWAVHNYSVERGDIVSLISPKDPDQKIIKRVVAFQGDVVSTLGYKKPFVRIPEGHCWVEGDHTGKNNSKQINIFKLSSYQIRFVGNSLDSNSFGPISAGLMTARAAYIVWPPARWQRLSTYLPKQRQPIAIGKSNMNGSSNGTIRSSNM